MSVILPRLKTNCIVEVQGERYRAELWNGKENFYRFVYIGENGLEDFERTEEAVSNAIKKGLIKTVN